LNCFENKCDEKISEIPVEFFCTSEKAAFHTAVEHFRDPGTSVEAIKMSLNGTQYASKLAGMDMSSEKLAQSVKSSLDKELSTKAFFTDDTAVISASQIDTYYKCPFGYFCKYGLKLSPVQSMDMSAIHKGNLVHKVLETIFSVRDTEGEFLILNDCAETDDEIKKLIDKCFDSYYKTEFNLDFGKSQRFIYDYNSLRNLSYTIVKYVQAELIKSKYKPYSTEYKFGKDTADRIIRFETDGGRDGAYQGNSNDRLRPFAV
jgi:ATP-dependent helicase/nuclease subunit B